LYSTRSLVFTTTIMNLRFIFFSLSFLFVIPLISQNRIKWSTWENLPNKLEKADKKFLVYFYYDGCKWCRVMEESTFSEGHIAKFVNQNFYPLRLNALSSGKLMVADKAYTSVRIGKYDFHELAAELLSGNMSFPSIVFLDEKFHKLAHFDSYIEIPKFEMLLSYYGGDHHKNTLWKRYSTNYCRESNFNSLVNDKH
jgi:thioredoxin-related protein